MIWQKIHYKLHCNFKVWNKIDLAIGRIWLKRNVNTFLKFYTQANILGLAYSSNIRLSIILQTISSQTLLYFQSKKKNKNWAHNWKNSTKDKWENTSGVLYSSQYLLNRPRISNIRLNIILQKILLQTLLSLMSMKQNGRHNWANVRKNA